MKIDYATPRRKSLTHGETDAVALMAIVTLQENHHSDDRFD
jgi:hypothetical protein